jgi:N-acetylmuramic acid 6-phosphate etherase
MVDKRYLKGIVFGMENRMLPPTTEQRPQSEPIDALSTRQAVALLLNGQQAAIIAVSQAAADIELGAQAMALAIRSGRSLIYAAAGSSGLMAVADACELPGTFGVKPEAIQTHMAGGVPTDGRMPGDTEDDEKAAEAVARNVSKGDVVIVLSASGTTPYAVAVATYAKQRGGLIIGIANNSGSKLLDLADVAICLSTPPEVIAGSTRLGAGTAQKAALNLMSTLMGIKLGHVYQGMMVNVVADNAKLVKRAAGIVAQIAGVTDAEAISALHQTQGRTKTAILVAAGCSVATAQDALAARDGQLGPCIHSLKSTQK